MTFIVPFIMYQFVYQYGLSQANCIVWWEITVEYTITMAQFGPEIKHPMKIIWNIVKEDPFWWICITSEKFQYYYN